MTTDQRYEDFLSALNIEIRRNWYKQTSELSLRAGMSQGNLSKIINKRTTAPFLTQNKIAIACGYDSVDDFINTYREQKHKYLDENTLINHNYFSFALLMLSKRDWFAKIDKLAAKAKLPLDILENILSNKVFTPPETQKLIANACGYTYEEFLKIGKKEEKRIREQIHPEDVPDYNSVDATAPTPLNPAYEILSEVLQERGEELTPAEVKKYANALKRIIAEEESGTPGNITTVIRENQELIKGFKDKETAKDFNRMLVELEDIDSDTYFDLYGETVKAYKKAKSRQDDPQVSDGKEAE